MYQINITPRCGLLHIVASYKLAYRQAGIIGALHLYCLCVFSNDKLKTTNQKLFDICSKRNLVYARYRTFLQLATFIYF
ncbi:MAG: hypothetical protein BGP13_19385 [Sphingobacteriales bacterium 40-81]|nr:MAG: hypothetical protein BGP13_19385 [Sphingobacteriales bacterium 40-81]